MASYLAGALYDVQAVQKLIDASKTSQSQSYTVPGPVTPSQPLIPIPSIQPSTPQATKQVVSKSPFSAMLATVKSAMAKVETSRYIQSKVPEAPKSPDVIQPFVGPAKTEVGEAIDGVKKPFDKKILIIGGIAAVVVISLLMRKKAA